MGRRIWKKYRGTTTQWLWDGNKPLHEWKEFDAREATADDIITWVFNEADFAPTAKIKGNKKYSLICDHLGTPTQGYNEEGSLIWDRELDSYGKVRMLQGEEGFCNYLYQGQDFDKDIELAYNRFRWYNQEEGVYISQDPISLESGEWDLYSYVRDVNSFIDPFGLTAELYKLVATKDGFYDVKQHGKPTVKGGQYLKKGDTYKFGETTQFNKKGVQQRYSAASLQRNNLRYVSLQNSPNKSAKKSFQKIETAKIDKHVKRFGKKPAGNSCRH